MRVLVGFGLLLAAACTWVVSLWYAVLSNGFSFARLIHVDRMTQILFGNGLSNHLYRIRGPMISGATWSWVLFAAAVGQLVGSLGLLLARGGGFTAAIAVIGFAVCLLDTLLPGINMVHQLDALSLVGSFFALPAALAVRRESSAQSLVSRATGTQSVRPQT